MPRCVPRFKPEAQITIVGEAPGQQEDFFAHPFVGTSGRELGQLLFEAGIASTEPPYFASPLEMMSWWESVPVNLTNVVLDRPPENDLLAFCCGKKDADKAYLPALLPEGNWPNKYTWSKIKQGKYLHPKFLPELSRLHAELSANRVNLIIALGGTASWALFDNSAITKVRGTVVETPYGKVLPTFHPAYIMRVFQDRPILLADLMKAKAQALFPEVRRPRREIWIDPTIEDLYVFKAKYLLGPRLFFDIETAREQITTIGFACDPFHALVVPFVDFRKPDYSYWSFSDEVLARRFVRDLLASPMPKCGQNGLYDIQYLLGEGMVVRNYCDDTMLLQHGLQPEMPKSLGFLGSIYTDEPAWKLMREREKDNLKKDD